MQRQRRYIIFIVLLFFYSTLAIYIISHRSPSSTLVIHHNVEKCNFGISLQINSDHYCTCPELSVGDSCESLNEPPTKYQKLVKMEMPWSGIFQINEGSAPLDAPDNIVDYANRVVTWQSGRLSPEITATRGLSKTDEFFMDVSTKYGPYTKNDAMVISALHEYNIKFSSTLGLGGDLKSVPGKMLFVLMVSKELDLIEYLFNTVYSKDHYYIFSLSSAATKELRQSVEQLVKMPNVAIIPENLSIQGIWSDVSLIYMEVVGVLHALMMGWTDWSWKFCLSETHFPAKPISALSSYLGSLSQSHVFFNLNTQPDERLRVVQTCLDTFCCDVHPLKANYKHLEEEFLSKPEYIKGGSSWHVESRNTLLHIYSSRKCIELLIMMKHAAVPEEIYYHMTVLYLSRSDTWSLANGTDVKIVGSTLVDTTQSRILTYIYWDGRASPREVLPEHFEDIKNSNLFFARKVKRLENMKEMSRYFNISSGL
ncbi:hypothetical protein AKO1_010260 [Acrasis kona]|uniref:protein xylosyltransferase n=1 Tax=Acrasis kona TaxID=1008807 RepID=A0AAW2ZQX2_9EUKA